MKKWKLYFNFFVGTCPDPTPENGAIKSVTTSAVNGRYPANTNATFQCNTGYTLNGYYQYSVCLEGKWDPLPAFCVANGQGV